MTQDITSLIEKLEGAEVGSRDLDAKVWACVSGYELVENDGSGWLIRMRQNGRMRHERNEYISPVTTKVDEALAYVSRVLPEWVRSLEEFNDGHWEVGLFDRVSLAHHGARSATPALALCAAILRAQSEAR